MKLMGPYKGYGHDVDASVANEMANAAFRYVGVGKVLFETFMSWQSVNFILQLSQNL